MCTGSLFGIDLKDSPTDDHQIPVEVPSFVLEKKSWICYRVHSRSGADVSVRPRWCATINLLLLMFPFHPWCLCKKAQFNLLPWNQGVCSSTMCMMYLHSADPVEPTYRWSIHCVISFTTTTKWTSQVGDDLMEQELIHVSLRSKNSCLGSFDGAEWRFGILLETSFHVREVVYV